MPDNDAQRVFAQLMDTEPALPDVAPYVAAAHSARGRRRWTYAAVGGLSVAAVVAALIVVPNVVSDISSAPVQPAAGAGKDPVPPADDFFVKTPLATLKFPLTRSFEPSGLALPPDVYVGGPGRMQLLYSDNKQPSSDNYVLGLTVSEAQLDTSPGFSSTPLTVLGRPATLSTDGSDTELTWLRKPGQWVQISGSKEFGTRSVLLRLAEGLVDRPEPGATRISIAHVPAGYELIKAGVTDVIFERAASAVEPPDQIQVHVLSDDGIRFPGRRVKVGSRTGTLQQVGEGNDSQLRLVIQLGGDAVIMILVPSADPWTKERLLRFAAGVRYNGPLPANGG